MTFSDFNFDPQLLEGLQSMGYVKPTPIQSQAIPLILDHKDLIACAQSGTGKTASYLLPVLQHISISEKKYTEAIENFDEAIELKENFCQAYHERGRAKYLNDDKEGSLEDMKKSIELDPTAEENVNGQFNNFADIYAGAKLF